MSQSRAEQDRLMEEQSLGSGDYEDNNDYSPEIPDRDGYVEYDFGIANKDYLKEPEA
jgi:hypothetical protein